MTSVEKKTSILALASTMLLQYIQDVEKASVFEVISFKVARAERSIF